MAIGVASENGSTVNSDQSSEDGDGTASEDGAAGDIQGDVGDGYYMNTQKIHYHCGQKRDRFHQSLQGKQATREILEVAKALCIDQEGKLISPIVTTCRGGNDGLCFECPNGHQFKISTAKLNSLIGKNISNSDYIESWCLKCRNFHKKCIQLATESKYNILSALRKVSFFKVKCHQGHIFVPDCKSETLSPGFVARGIEWCAVCFYSAEAKKMKEMKEEKIIEEQKAKLE